MEVLINNNSIKVNIIRKHNKNLYIRVNNDLEFDVTCNIFVSDKEILKVINDNLKSLTRMYNKKLKEKEKDAFYYYLGDKYTVIFDESVKKTSIENGIILVKDQKMLDKFYKLSCQMIFQRRLDYWANYFSNIPNYHLKIRKMTSRWGVCNRGNNNITLNSELIKKDITLLDYVCVHELSHFIEANHSKAFWIEVGKRYPNYKEARKRLREE